VPIEQYRKSFRQVQKYIERDIANTLTLQAAELMKAPSKEGAQQMVAKLTNLKRKLENYMQEAEMFCSRSLARMKHLDSLFQHKSTSDPDYRRWCHVMLERLLVDYMLREGLVETAKRISTEEYLKVEKQEKESDLGLR
jgi:macrophage erythroblast attacher